MEFRTIVDIPDPGFRIEPCEEMLFVGSCFATEIGRRFQEEKFRAVVNPFGVMYNPASILHTIQRLFLPLCRGSQRGSDPPHNSFAQTTPNPSYSGGERIAYFPAYEIVNDELRDYRFYKPDMLHPSDQAVEYIWQRLSETYLSDEAKAFIQEWAPLKAALNHKPFDAESEEYKAFMHKTMLKVEALRKKYPTFAM